MAVVDILRYGRPDLRARMQAEVDDAVRRPRFSLVVVSSPPILDFPALDGAYTLRGSVFREPEVFWPLTGAPVRPDQIYVPR
jgi:hypothetical protein